MRRQVGALLGVMLLAGGCGRRHEFVTRAPGAGNSVLIRNVRVFDAPRATALDGLRDVLVRDGRIAAVGPAGAAPAGVPEVDGRGRTLLPGLIDVHVHTGGGSGPPWHQEMPDPEEDLGAFLYGGVTTVLDAGNLTPAVFKLREKTRSGQLLGPHFHAAGPIFTAPGGHPVALLRQFVPWYLRWYVVPRFTREVATPAEARTAVAALLPEHPDVLKVAIDHIPLEGPCIAPEVVDAIVATGHASGVRTVVHIGRSADALCAAHAGADALLHGVYLEEISDEAVAALAARHMPVAATIAVFDKIERFLPDTRSDLLPIEREMARPATVDALGHMPDSFDRRAVEPFVRAVAAAHAARRTNVRKLRAAGVTVLAGSDSANIGHFPGAALHVELGKLVEAGMSPGEALRAATWDNAHFLAGEAADFGEIAPGKRADLVLVRGNPLAEIGAADQIERVFLDGVALERHPR